MNRVKSDFLFAQPSIASGAARVMDLWGQFDAYNDSASEKEADAMKQRLCSFQGTGAIAHGQDSALCQQMVHARPERRPTTTPPANNQGRSVPPRSHR